MLFDGGSLDVAWGDGGLILVSAFGWLLIGVLIFGVGERIAKRQGGLAHSRPKAVVKACLPGLSLVDARGAGLLLLRGCDVTPQSERERDSESDEHDGSVAH